MTQFSDLPQEIQDSTSKQEVVEHICGYVQDYADRCKCLSDWGEKNSVEISEADHALLNPPS